MIATITADETRSAEELVAPVAREIRQMAAQAEADRRLPDELVTEPQRGRVVLHLHAERVRRAGAAAARGAARGGGSRAAGWVNRLDRRVGRCQQPVHVGASRSLRGARAGQWRRTDRRRPCIRRPRGARGRWVLPHWPLGVQQRRAKRRLDRGSGSHLRRRDAPYGPERTGHGDVFRSALGCADHRHLVCHRLARERDAGPVRGGSVRPR